MLNASQRPVNKNSLTWSYVLKTSSRCLEDVFQDKTYSQDEYIGLDQDVLKTCSEDVRLRRTYSSWSRRLQDVFWWRRRKTSSRRLQDVFIKTNFCWESLPLLLDPLGKPDHQTIHCPISNFGPLSRGSVPNPMLITVLDTYLTARPLGAWI